MHTAVKNLDTVLCLYVLRFVICYMCQIQLVNVQRKLYVLMEHKPVRFFAAATLTP